MFFTSGASQLFKILVVCDLFVRLPKAESFGESIMRQEIRSPMNWRIIKGGNGDHSFQNTQNLRTQKMAAEKPVYYWDGEHLTPEDVGLGRTGYA